MSDVLRKLEDKIKAREAPKPRSATPLLDLIFDRVRARVMAIKRFSEGMEEPQ